MHDSEILPEPTPQEKIARALDLEIVDRAGGIGASDIAVVCGWSKMRRPIDLWLEKTGKLQRGGEEPELFYWGKVHQPAIIRRYAERAPRPLHELIQLDSGTFHRRGTPAFAVCSPDAVEIKLRLAVEAKFVPFGVSNWGQEGTEEVPIDYYAQAQWQMYVLGCETDDLAALLNGCRLSIYPIYYRAPQIDAMLEIAYKFWTNHVQRDVPPEIEDTESLRAWLRKAFPRQLEPPRLPTEQETILAVDYLEAAERLGAAEKLVEDLKAKLKVSIGDAEGLKLPGVFKATWKADRDSERVDWEALARRLATEIVLERTKGAGPKEVERMVRSYLPEYTTKVQGKRPLRVTRLEEEIGGLPDA